jgi:MoaA/NifB/PqqE/SkfB family radical SAM enzyme
MCPIKTSKRKEIVDNVRFTKILKSLKPYTNKIKFLSLVGLGEPLIDKQVAEKIKIAKKMGFHGTGIYTNGTLLDEKMAKKILDAKLDTLMVSIDGFTSKTQGAIRVGTNLDHIVSNVERFIALREKKKSKTKIVIRFIRQELNKHEEKDFYDFWKSRIKSKYNDTISIYNVHNYGGSLPNFDKKLNADLLDKTKKLKCPEIYDRLLIQSDGLVNFCCGDQFGHYHIGNVLEEDPVKLYNSKHYIHYREQIEKGNILKLELCKNCSVAYSIATRKINTPNEDKK